MDITVFFALAILGRTGTIFSFSVILVSEFGIICKFTGMPEMMTDIAVKATLPSHFLLRWCLLHGGIFESIEMAKFSEMKDLLLVDGELALSMIFHYWHTGLRLNTKINFSDGYPTYLL